VGNSVPTPRPSDRDRELRRPQPPESRDFSRLGRGRRLGCRLAAGMQRGFRARRAWCSRSPTTMHPGMGGYHEFWVPVRRNDPANAEQRLVVRSTWGP